MNKRDLIDAISGRMGDKKTATEAVNAVLDTIQVAVAKGDKVAITGFGVFEKSDPHGQEPSHRRVHQGAQVVRAQVPGGR
jgi:nucleoid DNA-binding protein